MPTKKEPVAKVVKTDESLAYDAALKDYASALDLLRKGNLEKAKEQFLAVRAAVPNETELLDRAATYIRICDQKTSAEENPPSGDDVFRQAVFLTNAGDADAAIALLDPAVAADPTSVDKLYVRACAWAIKGAADRAVQDLRQAISLDPRVRFQAVNDPDFEEIREEPAFIDIIEPTPAGA